MSNVIAMTRDERPFIDVETIYVLRNALGYDASRIVIDRATYEISDRLTQLEGAVFADNKDRIRILANSLVALSTQIGLMSVATIAKDVMACVDEDNEMALSAVTTRLIIHGEEALFSAAEFVA